MINSVNKILSIVFIVLSSLFLIIATVRVDGVFMLSGVIWLLLCIAIYSTVKDDKMIDRHGANLLIFAFFLAELFAVVQLITMVLSGSSGLDSIGQFFN